MPRTLTFKGCPIEAQETYEGVEIIITYCQPDPYDVGHYFYYVRNSENEILADNSHCYGEDNISSAISQAKHIIENFLP